MQWNEVVQYFDHNGHRSRLLGGLEAACRNLSTAGRKGLMFDSSVVTAKSLPGDSDRIWESTGIDYRLLGSVPMDFSDDRDTIKRKYLGDLAPVNPDEASGLRVVDLFRIDRNGVEKGLVRNNLEFFL